MLDEFAEPMTTIASHRGGDRHQRRLAVGGGEAQVAAAGRPQLGEALAVRPRARRPSRGGDSVVWASRATGLVELRAARRPRRRDSTRWIDVGRDRHRADRLLVALVADVDDAVALAGPHLHLVVDLGDERAHRVDDVAAVGPGRGDDLGGRAVGATA